MTNARDHASFKNLFDNLPAPVIVTERTNAMPVVYLNPEAQLFLAPSISVRKLKNRTHIGPLAHILRFEDPQFHNSFIDQINQHGVVNNMIVTLFSSEKEVLTAELSVNILPLNEREYLVIYLRILDEEILREAGITGEMLARIVHEAYQEKSADETIQAVITLAGRRLNVSRVYVFEDVNPEFTRNTYEWCADGVEPAIHLLQNLRKDDYQYDVIMSNPMFIYNDTRELPKRDRQLLYEMQGIKSVAIHPIYRLDKPLGYVGFDDTVKFRKWNRREIQVQAGVAGIVASLIMRRNAENDLIASREALQTITDNLDDLIFVADIKSRELKFVSKSLANSLGVEAPDLIGKPCRNVIELGEDAPGEPCPMPDLVAKDGSVATGTRIWQHRNETTGKWYLIKDSVIKWVDGAFAHLETATDITYQKQYEEQLKYSASTDAMTDVYNREWGYAKLKEIVEKRDSAPGRPHTLCFVDIDGLKSVNDRFGHAVGDEMIVNTIKTIFACIRKEDFICRWGGDEFLLLLYCDLNMARKVVDKIHFALDHFNQTQGKEYLLSVSSGAVELSPGADVDAAIALADGEMYRDKAMRKMRRRSTRSVKP